MFFANWIKSRIGNKKDFASKCEVFYFLPFDFMTTYCIYNKYTLNLYRPEQFKVEEQPYLGSTIRKTDDISVITDTNIYWMVINALDRKWLDEHKVELDIDFVNIKPNSTWQYRIYQKNGYFEKDGYVGFWYVSNTDVSKIEQLKNYD